MIVGHNNRGQIKHRFKSLEEFSTFASVPLETIKKGFEKDRIFNWNNCIFYRTELNFSEDFGYPQPKNTPIEEVRKMENKLGGQDGGNYDEKGNSSHYQKQFMEFIRLQERAYGTIVAYLVCVSNIDKYNQRAGQKEGVPASKDLTKRDWYQKAANHFKLKIEAAKNLEFHLEGRNSYVFMPEEVLDLIKTENPEQKSLNYVPLSICIEKE